MEAYLIEIADIPLELARIWDSLESSNKMRASLFNLILFTHKNARAAYIRTLAQKVIERFPSRVILITLDTKDKENKIEANASVLSGAKGEVDVVCDFIEFNATEASRERIPFVILPQIIPDLPVYLVWGEDPIEDNPLSHQLDKLATRLIFDSESTNDLSLFAKSVLQHKEESSADVADLNWARTESWRELLSLTFHSPERFAQLKEIKCLKIAYNCQETNFFCHTRTQAIYLQGWLAAQLQWILKSVENNRFLYQNIEVELIAISHLQLPPGTIISVDLLTTKQDHFSFCRNKENPIQIDMIFCDPEKCEVPSKYIFNKSQSGLSLVNEICHHGTSEHYLNLLNYLKYTGSS